jgi:S1-C subfamily serine protease
MRSFFLFLLLFFASESWSAEFTDGYEITTKAYSICKNRDDAPIVIKVNSNTYPSPSSFSIARDGTVIDKNHELLCVDHKRKEIYLAYDYPNNGLDTGPLCAANNNIDSNGNRLAYTPCNSIFYRTDNTQTAANHLMSCLFTACLASLANMRSLIFEERNLKTAVEILNLTQYMSFKDLFVALGNDIKELDLKTKKVIDKQYDNSFYNFEDFRRDYQNIKSRFESIDEEITRLNQYSDNYYFKENEKAFISHTNSYYELKKLIPKIEDKDLDFVAKEKISQEETKRKELEQKRQKLAAQDEAKRLKVIADKKLLAENEKEELILATKKLLFNLGYEVDVEKTNFDLKARTALVAFQKDFDINPIENKPNENLLSELQRAFRNSPNPLDLTNYDIAGSGSGFLVNEKGYVVTNVHVVDECSLITVGKRIPANIEKADRVNDVAILKINNNGDYVPLSMSEDDVELGEEIFVAGFPINMILENLNFTSGSISSEVGVGQNINQFQFTAPIQPGNSGGPIFNAYGGVIGIAVSTASTKEFEELIGTNIQNINFGIKASTIRSLLKQSDVPVSIGNPNWFKGQKNVASVAKTGTVLIQCWNENS